MKIAINHPYFIPYTGFFRMMAHADIYVALDCAQFPRRGYVHRNQLPDCDNQPAWLTLALEKQNRDNTLIKDIRFVEDITDYMQEQWRRFPSLQTAEAINNPLSQKLLNINSHPVELITNLLSETNLQLQIDCPIVRSSELDIDNNLKGEDKILAILQHLGADEYINAPGGAHLYTPTKFHQAGIKTRFLQHFKGNHSSILHRLVTEPLPDIQSDIHNQILWQT